jgi:quercetin 2,3-dioxygenase
MATFTLHPATSRGYADLGWLKSNHTFSFASYYNPARVHFGMLRVLNDDIVTGGMGFGTHPHDNMEIISIGLEGAIEHNDSMGNRQVIHAGEIQVMSAGTGIQHSEFNPNRELSLNFLQIWIFPKSRNVTPRYQQMKMDTEAMKNRFAQILSPDPDDAGVWIHQDAWFHMGHLDAGISAEYTVQKSGNGVYAFVISGSVVWEGNRLDARDGIAIEDAETLHFQVLEPAQVLLMEIPMR